MSDHAIKVDNISKAYRIGLKERQHDSLGEAVGAWVKSPLKNFKQLKSLSSFNNHEDEDIFWALKDISFEVNRGDVLGIIGKNGAGKSTLLKILSRITEPSSGRVEIFGRIASLLEVGTGFNPELTGRENVYLNGTILGMKKKEIDIKFDEIIDFSGIEKFIDTPVKRYSSGMKVRLAFAVAAHLESEILIIDEVLAVGDAEFQKKCLGKMNDISRGEGRTVLFVSHQLGSVASLCNKGMLLQNGKMVKYSDISNVLENYTTLVNNSKLSYTALDTTKDIFIESCSLSKNTNTETNEFLTADTMYVNIEICKKLSISNAAVSFTIQSNTGDYLSTFVKPLDDLLKGQNRNSVKVVFDCNILAANNYFLRLAIFDSSTNQVYDLQEMICPFKINDSGTEMARFEKINYGYFNLKYRII